MLTLLKSIMTPQIRSALAPAALFALGFVVVAVSTSLALRAATPMPDMMVLSPKLKDFETKAGQFDTVFIGTSRTNYHIVPDEVERGAAMAGCPDWSVYNFGVFGLNGAEQDWLIPRVMEMGGDSLKRIIIEDPLPNGRTLGDVTSDRARYFLGPQFWPEQVRNIRSFPESLPKRVFRGGLFAIGTGFDLSGVGRGAALAFPEAHLKEQPGYEVEEDGFDALGKYPTPDIMARHADFVNNPDRFETDLARYGAPTSEDTGPRARYLAERLDQIRARGYTTALYVSPDLAELDRSPRTGEGVRNLPGDHMVMNFNRPDVYPDFFQRDLWFDFSHFNETGARKLSVEVGRELCTLTTNSQKDATDYALR